MKTRANFVISQRALFVLSGGAFLLIGALIGRVGLDQVLHSSYGPMPLDYFALGLGVLCCMAGLILAGLEARATITSGKDLVITFSSFFVPLFRRRYQLGAGCTVSVGTESVRTRRQSASIETVHIFIPSAGKRVLVARFLDEEKARACKSSIDEYLAHS